MSELNIQLKNCNSIENGSIKIIENSLNIKYAINGTGKSTSSKAIEYAVNDNNNATSNLLQLKPFKYRNESDTNNPEVMGVETINSIAVFNEDYVNQIVLQPNEVLKNSFDIFINNDEYKNGMSEINELIKEISKTFDENQDIETMLNDLSELLQSFGNAKGLSKASSFFKGVGKGNLVENIPEELLIYKDFIQNEKNTTWLKWQMSGKDYLDISSCCPFCTSSNIEEKKETILTVEKKYDSKLIEHLNKVIQTVSKLKAYFTQDTYDNIISISKNVGGLKKEEETFLLEIREQISTLIEKLKNIKILGFQSLKDFDKVDTIIKDLKINIEYINHLNTETTSQKINKINDSLDSILQKSGQLQGKVRLQKIRIEETIKTYKDEINDFLKYAGYNYSVNIEEDTSKQTYTMKLKHIDFIDSNIDNARNHLSYGEKNAFALILFMYDVLKNNQQLIILDDPISSFDKNKKFAIIEKLFRGDNSLKNKTVLMLTHDFEPIVDIILHHSDIFNVVKPNAYFLENIDGVLYEKSILRDDIKTFLEIAQDNILSLDEQINKLIYLRRLNEVTNNKGLVYQLLSNIFHKREVPKYQSSTEDRNMTEIEINYASEEIKNSINEPFVYSVCFQNVNDNNELIRLYEKTTNNYEKLQIYRVLNNDNHENRTIRKFINETFHIENDYIYQLNPCKYQTVPNYIIKECDKDIEIIKQPSN
jgi:energy-coupling factor transporter ATP-binding protein EcfA2